MEPDTDTPPPTLPGLQFASERERAFWDSACVAAGPQSADAALMGRRIRSATLKPPVPDLKALSSKHADLARELGWFEAAQFLHGDGNRPAAARLVHLQDQRAENGNEAALELVRRRPALVPK